MAFGTDTPYPVFQKTSRPQYISLAAARADPSIVYHSVKHLDRAPVRPQTATSTATTKQRKPRHTAPKPVTSAPRFQPPIGMTLIPLRLAAVRDDIKYRKEGFEMREHRRHIQAVRADPF